MRTVIIELNKNCPAYDYIARNTAGTRAVRNTCNFLIRNSMTALNKPENERTELEREALEKIFTGLKIANEKRLPKGEKLLPYPTAKKWNLSYAQLDAILKYTEDDAYYECTSQVNQQAIKKTVASWKAYFKTLRDYKQNPGKYKTRPNIPGYIRAVESTAHFTNQVAKEEHKDGKLYIKLSGFGFLEVGPENLISASLVKVEFKPWYGKYRMMLTYDENIEEPELPKHPERIMGIDLGVNNFASAVSNTGMTPFLIDGKYLKSVNQWFNKHKAELSSSLKAGGKDESNSKALDSLSCKRKDTIRDFFYKAAHNIVRKCVSEGIEAIVVGHNNGQKQNVNTGKKNNQNFTSIPYSEFIEALRYVSWKYGIPVVVRGESYTSKASLIDKDPIPTYGDENADKIQFSGKRSKRGIYTTNSGISINADINGAGNILRKEYPYAFDNTDMGYLYKSTNKVKYRDLYPLKKPNPTKQKRAKATRKAMPKAKPSYRRKNHKSQNVFFETQRTGAFKAEKQKACFTENGLM